MNPATIARRDAGARAVERRAIRRYTDMAKHDAANLGAAEIIAADPAKYPPESLAQRWATLVLARLDGEIPQMRAA